MKRFEEFVFPRRLHRIPYLIRIIVADVCLWLLLSRISLKDHPGMVSLHLLGFCVGAFVIGLYSPFFVLLPRVNDAGWNAWWIVLGVFPYLSPLFHFVMLFIPPADEVADESTCLGDGVYRERPL